MMFELDKLSYRAGVADAVHIAMEAGDRELAERIIEETDIDTGRPRPDLVEFIKQQTQFGGKNER